MAGSDLTTVCAEEGCTEEIANHKWAKIRAVGWFQQKDGKAWCPKHTPEWVEAWRKNR